MEFKKIKYFLLKTWFNLCVNKEQKAILLTIKQRLHNNLVLINFIERIKLGYIMSYFILQPGKYTNRNGNLTDYKLYEPSKKMLAIFNFL